MHPRRDESLENSHHLGLAVRHCPCHAARRDISCLRRRGTHGGKISRIVTARGMGPVGHHRDLDAVDAHL